MTLTKVFLCGLVFIISYWKYQMFCPEAHNSVCLYFDSTFFGSHANKTNGFSEIQSLHYFPVLVLELVSVFIAAY